MKKTHEHIQQGIRNRKTYCIVQKSLQHIAMKNQHENKLQGRTNMKIDCNEEYAPKHNARRKKTKT